MFKLILMILYKWCVISEVMDSSLELAAELFIVGKFAVCPDFSGECHNTSLITNELINYMMYIELCFP